jgi:thiol:disulfide interchange protein DsbA
MMRITLAALWLAASSVCQAEPMEGADYTVIEPRAAVATGPIEVIEFFYYGCGACARFEPLFEAWRRGADADTRVRRVPVADDAVRWLVLARLYFVLEQLGLVDTHHAAVFNAIHRRDRNLASRAEQIAWAKDLGIDAVQFERALDSTEVERALQEARDLRASFRVHSTPSMVIDGHYLTSAAITGDLGRLIPVTEELIDKVRRERGKAK